MLKTEDNRELSLQLFVVLIRAYNSVTSRSNRDIQSHGLNSTEFGVLDLLYHKGPQALQKIGEKVLMSSGNITYVVDKLQNKNLLFRRPSKEDRRVIYAELTEEGKQLFTQIFPQHHQVIIDILEGLEPSEKVEAIRLLKKLGLAAEGKTDLRI
ncbi:MarR family transcriptional regulator [Paenibacillus polysaccharolyticus]|jgi:MarR family 2-MHQ and catechol resistance regulon transcriptional repressor|uniref:MarR family transcriptional regulator n=2 Tax=Paenibacillus TaxID=44249 RepID=A0A5M9WSD2_PAEAM|nr:MULTISPECIES: MarR family transcriptional regulator [Paenibacillus]MDP9698579.1 MarR family 2-MHQ and catechol resistance regulon transcriptional repressor [Paenibacillus intestini]KAA8784547.1 MarR family transcriptional regulator [Paenibacillus amylolyticus]MBY0205333.1 MarR family transcriptional regulator [Paenibacillus cucumis (ex Kampfer et al. 2016)]MCM3131806.1 MarR family transcriptional regulator [Paenibacillus polysaccharolyticus]MCP1134692.1 MarR family transcriptional regulator